MRHGFAGLLLPLQQRRFGDRLAELRDLDFYDSHCCSLVLELFAEHEALQLAEGLVEQRLLLLDVQVRVAHRR